MLSALRRTMVWTASLAVLGGVASAPPASAAAGRRTNSIPQDIAVGSDGSLWFTELFGNRIGRINTSGAITEFALGAPTSANNPIAHPKGIAAGSDGAMWFTDGSEIGRITTRGAITRFAVPDGDTIRNVLAGGLGGIAAGPDGALWFTYGYPLRIGRITTAGKVSVFPLPSSSGMLGSLAAGPDGALWFGADGTGLVGRITTGGAVTQFPVPSGGAGDFGIAAGSDGALWFTRGILNNDAITRITTNGAVTSFALRAGSGPTGITPGPDGAMWFTETQANKVGRITGGAVSEFAVPTKDSGPWGIVRGRDRALWFTEQNADKIARITQRGAVREYALPPLVFVNVFTPGARCTPSSVVAIVKAKLLRNGDRLARVALLVDGRLVRTTTRASFHVRLPVNVGSHTFKAVVLDTSGHRATFSRTYRRCAKGR